MTGIAATDTVAVTDAVTDAPVVIYGDFTDAWSYLASRLLGRSHTPGDLVQWRAVVGHRTLTVVPRPWPSEEQPETLLRGPWPAALRDEAQAVTAPPSAVNPGPPVSGYAEAVGAGVGDAVRHLLFDAYWTRGADIGNPEVLRRLLALPILHGNSPSSPVDLDGYVVAPSGSPVTTTAWRRIRGWQQEWEALGRPALPTVVDGEVIAAGRDALQWLASRLPAAGISAPAPGDPYPLPPLRGDKRRVDLPRPRGVTFWWQA